MKNKKNILSIQLYITLNISFQSRNINLLELYKLKCVKISNNIIKKKNYRRMKLY